MGLTNNLGKLSNTITSSGGNIGIGTTNTDAPVTVYGNIYAGYGGPASNRGLYLGNSGVQASLLYNNSNGNLDITPRSGYNTVFTAGNVGIGTTSPSQKLTISGSGDQHILQNSTTASNCYTIYTNSAKSYAIGLSADVGPYAWQVYDLTSSAARLVITSGGNVGIGTTTPARKFVVQNTSADPFISILGAYPNQGGILFGDVTYNDSSCAIRMDRDNNALWFSTNGASSEKMRITSGGNVGIGTSSPNFLLGVNGSGVNSYMQFTSATTGTSSSDGFIIGSGDAGDAILLNRESTNTIFFTANTERMRITSGGNVGIGVTNPTNALQVQGNVYSTDTVIGRNIAPYAFAGPSAGSPTGAGIPMGYSFINISSPCDGNWRPLMNNINDVKGWFWVTLGDAASKDTGNWFMSMTSPAYGVSNMGAITYQDNGWNTGGFDFTYDSSGGTYRLLVRCTSYYSSGNTAYGTIYFLRIE